MSLALPLGKVLATVLTACLSLLATTPILGPVIRVFECVGVPPSHLFADGRHLSKLGDHVTTNIVQLATAM